MNMYTRFKNWANGNAGFSQLSHLQETAFSERCSMDTVDNLINKFESDVKSIEDKFPRSITETSESDIALDSLINRMAVCIASLPEPVKVETSDVVPVETRTLEEVINSYSDTTGCALINSGKIVKINNAFYKAACTGSAIQDLDPNNPEIDLLKILPRDAVAKLRSYFTVRYLNIDINVEVSGHTYVVVLSEFVKDSVCYRKIVVNNII